MSARIAQRYHRRLITLTQAAADSAVEEDEMSLGTRVTKTEDLSGTQDDLFTVTGKVLITLLTSEVTDAIGAAVTDWNMRIKTEGTDIIGAQSIANSPVGTVRVLGGDGSLYSLPGAQGIRPISLTYYVIGLAGGSCTIEAVHTAGDAGDAMVWTLYYLPLEPGASVAAAA